MRLVNDREEKTEKAPENVFDIVALAFLCSLGLASGLLGPLPMLLAETRLAKPWAKVACLAGAVLSVLALGISIPVVLVGFVTGIYIADSVSRSVPLWKMLLEVGGVGALLFGALLFAFAQFHGVSIGAAWSSAVDILVSQLQLVAPNGSAELFEGIRDVLFFEGPFLFISALLFTTWLSVGFASHLGWLKSNPNYSPESLRGIRVARGFSALCFVWIAALLFLKFNGVVEKIAWGIFRPMAIVLLIQGTVSLSRFLARRVLSPWIRSWVYIMALTFGFYALIGAGAIAPWLPRTRSAK